MDKDILQVRDLTISFGSGKNRVEVVSDISLDVRKGEIVCLVGESGCGKTVTALSVMGLLPVPPGNIDSGEIIFDGVDLLGLNDRELRNYRGNKLSMIFQEPVSSLNPVFTVGEQIGEAIRAHKKLSRQEERKRVVELLDLVGIPGAEKRYDSYPHELSGGMCQRVMIAMALSCDPQLLIADEPTTALDVTIQASILELIMNLRDELGMAVLLITHDLGIVSEIGDEVYVLYAGKVAESGSSEQIFNEPSHPYTFGLINSVPTIHTKKDKLESIPGFIPNPEDFPPGCRFNNRCALVIQKCIDESPPLFKMGNGHYSACFRSNDIHELENEQK